MSAIKFPKASKKPEGWYCEVPLGTPLSDGDRFKIAGIKMLPDGRFITNCPPEHETEFIAKVREAD